MNERQLDKIKKCLELSKSANENEAATALKMAQSLMKKYGLSDKDVEFSSLGKATSNESIPKKPPVYLAVLINIIGDAFGVDSILVGAFGGGMKCQYIGESSRAEIAAYSFDVISRLVIKARRDYVAERFDKRHKRSTKTSGGDAFAIGFVGGIKSKLPAMERTEQEIKLVSDFVNDNYGELEQSKVTDRESKDSHRHYGAGFDKGENAAIHSGINGSQARQKLIN